MSECGNCGSSGSEGCGGKKGSLLTGPFTSFDPDKGIFCEGCFEDGVMNGAYSESLENGKVILKGSFVRGLRHGEWAHYDEEGNLDSVKIYFEGRLIEENTKSQKR